MNYLPDTNVCVHYLRNPHSVVAERLMQVAPTDIIMCDIVVAELLYGAHKSAQVDMNIKHVSKFCALFKSLPFDTKSAVVYGRVRKELDLNGTPIGANDLLIASIALANDLTLITHNVREFSRVPGLRFEDWEDS